MSERRYTAQEMRNKADIVDMQYDGHEAASMLRYASEVVERCGLMVPARARAIAEYVALDSVEQEVRAALLDYAAMVERCNKLIAKYNKMPCKQCADGEVEPDCPYYGEPNGCNSPTYHEFHDWSIADIGYILHGDAVAQGA